MPINLNQITCPKFRHLKSCKSQIHPAISYVKCNGASNQMKILEVYFSGVQEPFLVFFFTFYKIFCEQFCSLVYSYYYTICLMYSMACSIARFIPDNSPIAELMDSTLRLMFSRYSLAAFRLFSAGLRNCSAWC